MSGAFGRSGGGIFLAALALLFGVFMVKGQFLQPPPIKQGSAFDAKRAFDRLERVLGDERPHPVDSDANDAVRERILAEITGLGLSPDVRDDFICRSMQRWRTTTCARVRNIVLRLGPQGGNALLVSAHYDSVAAGPGASDDGAGVAGALEIAARLKDRSLKRPVIFLLTDGEELGLLGAASFVSKDPYAKDVAAVVNMEARGVDGPAIMFETGTPNGREVRAFAAGAPHPVSNSLATAIYKLLPNDTDMTEFLALKPDALNIAYAGRVSLYHTPGDNLAHLDKRSLGHVGSSALGSIERLLATASGAPDGDLAFVDLFGQTLIALSYPVCLALFAVGLIGAAALYGRSGGGGAITALLVPPIAAVLAAAFAYAAFLIVGLLRPAVAFWSAYPAASQAVLYLSAITGAAISLVFVGAAANSGRLTASAWLWFLGLGAIAFHFAPGSAGVTAPLAAVFAAAALISVFAPFALRVAAVIAALAAFVIWAPLLEFAESALGLGAAWPFAPFAALLVCMAAPAALSDGGRPGWRVPALTGAALVSAIIAARLVPAYSPHAPMPLNIAHQDGPETNQSWFILTDRKTTPASFARTPGLAPRSLKGFGGEVLAAPAAAHGGAPVGVEVVEIVPQTDGRRLSLKFDAPDADFVSVWIPPSAGVKALQIEGDPVSTDGDGGWTVRCPGRSCRNFTMTAVVGAKPSDWEFVATRYGLGDAASAALARLRTKSETPVQQGDVRRVLIVRSM